MDGALACAENQRISVLRSEVRCLPWTGQTIIKHKNLSKKLNDSHVLPFRNWSSRPSLDAPGSFGCLKLTAEPDCRLR
jgi:hypothetical protein